jgi:hypothetical protein
MYLTTHNGKPTWFVYVRPTVSDRPGGIPFIDVEGKLLVLVDCAGCPDPHDRKQWFWLSDEPCPIQDHHKVVCLYRDPTGCCDGEKYERVFRQEVEKLYLQAVRGDDTGRVFRLSTFNNDVENLDEKLANNHYLYDTLEGIHFAYNDAMWELEDNDQLTA